MQRLILTNKNNIAFASGILIAVAFLSKWMFASTFIFNLSLIIASILGVTPIAFQAYQAARKGCKHRCFSHDCGFRRLRHPQL